MKSFKIIPFLLLLFTFQFATAESYHRTRISELDFKQESDELREALSERLFPTWIDKRINIRTDVESHLAWPKTDDDAGNPKIQGEHVVVFRLENEEPIEGFIDLRITHPFDFSEKIQEFAFTFTPGEETRSDEAEFNRIRALEAASLAENHLPGTAWFRHLAESEEIRSPRLFRRRNLSESFDILSGARAVSENLALDRELILAGSKTEPTIPVSEIEGVTTAAIDWSSRLPDEEVPIDRLAMFLPEDQHALFTKGFPELLKLSEQIEEQLMPSLQSYSVRNPFRKIVSRYRKQMGLDLPDFIANLIPTESVALTGGDPFFPQGTDIAILIETEMPDQFYDALLALIRKKAEDAGAKELASENRKHQYRAFESDDRSFSSHIWKMKNGVAIANSVSQFDRLAAVAEGDAPALGETDEFRFFRNRYPISEDQTGFLFLSDATIRRWAAPEVRIAASRRIRAITAMGELTSQAVAGQKPEETFEPLLGKTEWENGKFQSEVFNNLGFLTPVSELAITEVSSSEKNAYEQWRTRYEEGWIRVFDPIAVSITEKENELAFDLSVIPLTAGSDYNDFIELTGNARLGEKARWTPDESLFHLAVSLDTSSRRFREFSDMALGFFPGLSANPFAWMSGDISLELEKSLFWQSTRRDFFNQFFQTPLVLRIGSKNRMQLGLFVTGLRKMIEESAPDSMKWQKREKYGKSYVAISSNEFDTEFEPSNSIYYATPQGALLVSLTEEGLLRAMAREDHRLSPEETAKLPPADQILMESNPEFLLTLGGMFEEVRAEELLQNESWKALPILNEWHRRFPEKNPIEFQLAAFGEDIHCPGGKGYRWNPEAKTIESVAFGHPGNPKMDPKPLSGISSFENIRTGLTFEEGGLRARLLLGKQPERIATPAPQPSETAGALLATAEELTPLVEGAINRYRGSMFGLPFEKAQKVQNIRIDETGTEFEMITDRIVNHEEAQMITETFRLENDLFLTGYSNNDETYSIKGEIALPAKLISHEKTNTNTTYSRTDSTDAQKTIIQQGTILVIGKEDVTVPAGEFKDCIKLEISSDSLYEGYFSRHSSFDWYHPDVGLVKSESIDGEDHWGELESREIP